MARISSVVMASMPQPKDTSWISCAFSLLGDVLRRAVHARVVRPLVEHMHLGCIGQLPDRILGHDDQTERRDQLVDAVVDLRVNVVRTACDNGNVKVVLVRVADGALPLDANVR